jgi:hypothetical protein
MNIIAKLKCEKVESNESASSKKSYENVSLCAVYSEDKTSENYSFSQATPWAHLQMNISNPGAFDFFKEGQEYRVIFEKA